MATLFTKIIDGDIPGRFVWADEVAVAFGTIAPITDGHVLVVPRAEIVQLTEAPDDVLAHLMLVARTIGQAQQRAWDAPRAALLVAGFEVPHLHLHVLPAWDEASLTFRNARPDLPAADLDAAAERVRAALVALGHGAHVPASLGSHPTCELLPVLPDGITAVGDDNRRAGGRVAPSRVDGGRQGWRDVVRRVWPRSRGSPPGS